MKPCFGYIRVSTERQGDGASLEAQKDAITGFASQNNLQIVEWFEERETASKIGRPIFGQMMKALQRGDAEGLIVHKIDRSARNYRDWSLIDDVLQLGIKVYSAADNLDFGTRSGRLMADIQMALAADYSRNLSLEVKKGIYGRIKNGIYPFRAPIGYLDTGGGNLKAVDPAKAPLVRQVFDLYCTGDYSITSLTEEMRRRGLKGFGGRLVVRRNIETILRNPFYCGKMVIRGKLYAGAHEPLITTAVFRRVASIKEQRFTKKSTKHQMLFRGLFTCGGCGRILTGERQKARIYYRCHTAGCGQGAIREDRLDEAVRQRLSALEITEKDQTVLSKDIQKWLADDGQEELERSLRLRISDAAARMDRLTDLLVDGALDKPAYELRKQNFEFELQQLREELAASDVKHET
ncbi:MAG TPA: recombinase family protein [Devosia sp.]|nr:recombinase family protein [Devosia sp.]